MKPQPQKPQPLFVDPLTMWTDLTLKAGEMMLASAQAVTRKAKSSEFLEPATPPTRAKSAKSRSRRGNGKAKTKAKR